MSIIQRVYHIVSILCMLALIAALVYFVFFKQAAPKVMTIGDVKQDIILPPLDTTALTNPVVLLDSVNSYRTGIGWIASSNSHIYAGLVDRVWSASYTVPMLRHELTLWLGTGIGVSYQYQLFDSWALGGTLLYSRDSVSCLAGIGYRW